MRIFQDCFRPGLRSLGSGPATTAAIGLVALAALSACSGGGGSGGGDEGPGNVSTPLVVSGVVTTDTALTGVTVTAQAGATRVSTTTDASGRFSVSIPAQDTAAPLVLTADEPASQGSGASPVVLRSILPSLATLTQAAGDDARLTADEHAGVNITHVSTAAAGLVGRDLDGLPASDAALDAALQSLDPQRQVQAAAAVALIRDAGRALPEGVADTLALAGDPVAAEALLLVDQEQSATDRRRGAVLFSTSNNPAVLTGGVPGTVAATFPVTLLLVRGDADVQRIPDPDLQRELLRLRLEADGSGQAVSNSHDTAMTWTRDGVQLRIDFARPRVLLYANRTDTGERPPVEVETGLRLVPIGGQRVLVVSSTELAGSPGLAFHGARVLTEADVESRFSDINDPAGGAMAAPIFLDTGEVTSPSGNVHADVLRFDTGGGGASQELGLGFTWSRTVGGLRVDFADGSGATYRLARRIDDCAALWLADIDGPDGQQRTGVYPVVCADPSPTGFAISDVDGFYYRSGIGDEPRAFDDRLFGFGLRLASDRTGNVFFDSRRVFDGEEVVVYPGGESPSLRLFWNIDGDNRLVIDRTYRLPEEDFGIPQFGCTPGTDGCIVWERLTAQRLAQRGDTEYWLESLRRDMRFDGENSAVGLPPAYTARLQVRRAVSVRPQR